MDRWALLGSEVGARIRFEEPAHGTAKGAHRNAFFLRDLRAPEPGLLRRSLNPCADHALGTLGFKEEPVHHLAVALGTPRRFHAQVSPSENAVGMARLQFLRLRLDTGLLRRDGGLALHVSRLAQVFREQDASQENVIKAGTPPVAGPTHRALWARQGARAGGRSAKVPAFLLTPPPRPLTIGARYSL